MEMEFNGDGDAVPGELLQLQDPGPELPGCRTSYNGAVFRECRS